jgi:hypothetical protein
VSEEDGFVTFQARVGDKIGGSKETIPVCIPGCRVRAAVVSAHSSKGLHKISSVWRLFKLSVIAK